AGTEDLLSARARRALDRGGDDPRGIGRNLLPVPEGSAAGSVRRGVGGGRHGVRDHRADDRPHLGEADLGDVVDVGCPADVHPVSLLSVRGISARARRAAGGAYRPCLTCPRTRVTWWRPTS